MAARKYSNNFLFRKIPSLLSLLVVVAGLAAVTAAAQQMQLAAPKAKDIPSITIEGVYQTIHSDDFKNKKSETSYRLKTATGEVKLDGPLDRTIKPGSKVKIQYRQTDSKVEMLTALTASNTLHAEKIDSPETAAAETIATGDKRIAAVIVNFSDAKVDHPTVNEAHTFLNTTISPFFYQDSFEKLRLTADVYGPINLDVTMPAGCGLDAIKDIVIPKVDPQIDFRNYQFLMMIYSHPPAGCPYGGVAGLGPDRLNTEDGQVSIGLTGITSSSFNKLLVSHELGHNLGGMHSNAWECGPVAVGGDCQSIGYGDWWEPLGSGQTQFGSFHKSVFGWTVDRDILVYNPNNPLPTYQIYPINLNSNYPKISQINRGNGSWYFIESRTRDGFNAGLPDEFVNGVIIYLVTPGFVNGGDVHLIDTTSNSWPESVDFTDAPLAVGKSFSDPTTDITVTLDRKDANGYAVVKISRYSPPTDFSGTTSPLSVAQGGVFQIACDYGRPGLDCISASSNSGPCVWAGNDGSKANFTCNADSVGLSPNTCSLFTGTPNNCGARTDPAGSVTVKNTDPACSIFADRLRPPGRWQLTGPSDDKVPLSILLKNEYNASNSCRDANSSATVKFFLQRPGTGYSQEACSNTDAIPQYHGATVSTCLVNGLVNGQTYQWSAAVQNELFAKKTSDVWGNFSFTAQCAGYPEMALISPANGVRISGITATLRVRAVKFKNCTNTRRVNFYIHDVGLADWSDAQNPICTNTTAVDGAEVTCPVTVIPGHSYKWWAFAANETYSNGVSSSPASPPAAAQFSPAAAAAGEDGDAIFDEREEWNFEVAPGPTSTPRPTPTPSSCTAAPETMLLGPPSGINLSSVKPRLLVHPIYNCPYEASSSGKNIELYVKDKTVSGNFDKLCGRANDAMDIDLSCDLNNWLAGHSYEWYTKISNPIGTTQSDTWSFNIASRCKAGTPTATLMYPTDGGIAPDGAGGLFTINLLAYVSFQTCSGSRYHEIFTKDVTPGAGGEYTQLCYFTSSNISDKVISCLKTVERGHTYKWYAGAKNDRFTGKSSENILRVRNTAGQLDNLRPEFSTKLLPSAKRGVLYQTSIDVYDYDVDDTVRLAAGSDYPAPSWLSIGACTQKTKTGEKVEFTCPVSGTPPQQGISTINFVLTDNHNNSVDRKLILKVLK